MFTDSYVWCQYASILIFEYLTVNLSDIVKLCYDRIANAIEFFLSL